MFIKSKFDRYVHSLFRRYTKEDNSRLVQWACYAFDIAAPLREKASLIHSLGIALDVPSVHLLPPMVLSEVIMASALTIDDMVDRSVSRVGKPSLVTQVGREKAIFVAQFMLTVAEGYYFSECIKRKDKYANRAGTVFQNFLSANGDIQQGQYLTVGIKRDPRLITLELMDKLAHLKAGSLFGATVCAAALLAGKELMSNNLARIGDDLGVALQHRNDLCDVMWPSNELGRKGYEDLFNGHPNLVLAYFFNDEKINKKDQNLVQGLWRIGNQINQHGAVLRKKINQIIRLSGAVEQAKQHLEFICKTAKNRISKLPKTMQKPLLKFIQILEGL